MSGAVLVEQLTKTCQIKQRKGLFKSESKNVDALKGISLEIKPCELFGLLMPLLRFWLYRAEENRAQMCGTLSEY